MYYDVSKYQRGVNLNFLPDCEGVIIRLAIDGEKDTACENFISQCKTFNIPFGFYIYIKSVEIEEMKEEFLKSLEIVKAEKLNTLPIFIDIEEHAHSELNKTAITDFYLFCKFELNKINRVCGLYSMASYLLNVFDYKVIKNELIWLAHWTDSPDNKSSYIDNFPLCLLWQFGVVTVDGDIIDANIYIPEKTTESKTGFVKVNPACRFWYDGVTIAEWVYKHVFEIFELTNDRAVIGITDENGEKLVTGAINIKDLIIL